MPYKTTPEAGILRYPSTKTVQTATRGGPRTPGEAMAKHYGGSFLSIDGSDAPKAGTKIPKVYTERLDLDRD